MGVCSARRTMRALLNTIFNFASGAITRTGAASGVWPGAPRPRSRASRPHGRADLLGQTLSPFHWSRPHGHGLCSGRCSHRPTSRGSPGGDRRLRANAATEATTARPAVAPHIEAGDGRPADGRVPVGGRLARPVVALPSASSMERPMLASADEPRFTMRRPAFASKRRDGGNDSAPGGRAAHRGGRRPPRRRAGSCRGSSRPLSGCAPLGIVYGAADARIGRRAGVRAGKAGVCKQTPLRRQRQRARRSRPTSRRETASPPQSRSTSKQGLVFHVWGSRAARAVSYSLRAFSRARASCLRCRWAARTRTMSRLG